MALLAVSAPLKSNASGSRNSQIQTTANLLRMAFSLDGKSSTSFTSRSWIRFVPWKP